MRLIFVDQVCMSTVNITTDVTNTQEVMWIPSENPRLDFQVKTSGVARISIRNTAYYPKVTAFIGVNKTIKYKGMIREKKKQKQKRNTMNQLKHN